MIEHKTAEAQTGTEPHEHHIPRAKVIAIAIGLSIVVAAAWLVGYLPRRDREQAAANAAGEVRNSVPIVTIAEVRPAPADVEIVLPGSLAALSEASIYARATGYVRKRYIDIGDRVKSGQLLAELDAPDLDQQVAQARAALAQANQQMGMAKASLIQSEALRDLAKATLTRYEGLVKSGAVSQQDYDSQASNAKTSDALVTAQQSNVAASQENVNQAKANLDRVVALQDFKNVRAPFDGVVTVRNVDVGFLISSTGGSQGTSPTAQPASATTTGPGYGNEIFRVAQLETLRIFASVPQAIAATVKPGMSAAVTFADRPGQEFSAHVTRTANTLDPAARTLLTELQLPNKDGKLFPGMYASVHFRNHRDVPPLLV
ncbi:MAG TPA: efflux RND transporter periplasmic adaptor subunit, partial [Bryobacteraceae bacterium]|nr:efflux RND transporter periplasmic adaptor subunit [Bryobacteraceae bacterium]